MIKFFKNVCVLLVLVVFAGLGYLFWSYTIEFKPISDSRYRIDIRGENLHPYFVKYNCGSSGGNGDQIFTHGDGQVLLNGRIWKEGVSSKGFNVDSNQCDFIWNDKKIWFNQYDRGSGFIQNWQEVKGIDAKTFEVLDNYSLIIRDRFGVYMMSSFFVMGDPTYYKMTNYTDILLLDLKWGLPVWTESGGLFYLNYVMNPDGETWEIKKIEVKNVDTKSLLKLGDKCLIDKNFIYGNTHQKSIKVEAFEKNTENFLKCVAV